MIMIMALAARLSSFFCEKKMVTMAREQDLRCNKKAIKNKNNGNNCNNNANHVCIKCITSDNKSPGVKTCLVKKNFLRLVLKQRCCSFV